MEALNIERLRSEFQTAIDRGYNRVALTHSLLADVHTPVALYSMFAGTGSYLFESVEGGERFGRYSIVGLPTNQRLLGYPGHVDLIADGEVVQRWDVDDPLVAVAEFRATVHATSIPHIERTTCGVVGYFSYDMARCYEEVLGNPPPSLTPGMPLMELLVSDRVIVHDNLKGTATLIVYVTPDGFEEGIASLEQMCNKIEDSLLPAQLLFDPQRKLEEAHFTAHTSPDSYMAKVEQARELIHAGEVFQVVLAQAFSLPFTARPFDLYRALRYVNPSPYMYFLDFGDRQVVGSSPEILARLEPQRKLTARPIAGTRRRGATDELDVAMEEELVGDPKERAEHLMLIDLTRNDVGRLAQPGSVAVEDAFSVERYSHVMHLVSTVTGKAREEVTAEDVLRVMLPHGTVSGAPKIRAMQIIDQLEDHARGLYAGSVGYIGWDGNMDTAIAIRTAMIQDQMLYMSAGAGIVADSQPRLEQLECINKARAIMHSTSMVQEPLN